MKTFVSRQRRKSKEEVAKLQEKKESASNRAGKCNVEKKK
jgi:hypothetical protein